MTVQRGKDILLKIDTEGNGYFATVAGLRSRSIALNTEIVDISHAESSGRWRELLSGAGVRKASISGSGVFRDEAADELIRDIFFKDQTCPWQIIIPSFGVIQGAFIISALEYAGTHNAEVTFDLNLESAGELSFNPI